MQDPGLLRCAVLRGGPKKGEGPLRTVEEEAEGVAGGDEQVQPVDSRGVRVRVRIRIRVRVRVRVRIRVRVRVREGIAGRDEQV